ncbi:MAG: CAP domain-containing protein [Sporolactobacillus sp.]
MRKTNITIFVIALLVFTATFLLSLVSFPGSETNQRSPENRAFTSGTSGGKQNLKLSDKGIYSLMGKKRAQVLQSIGKPDRIDPTNYGYQWYIYGRNTERYVQVGIDQTNGTVTTIYALGRKLNTTPFPIGTSSQKIYEKVPISDEVAMTDRGTKINFELNEEDMMMRPLLKFGKYWVQLNFDHISDRLVAIRYMSAAVLARQHPYSMTYYGQLPRLPSLAAKQWEAVDAGSDQEIFDISNLLRYRYKKPMLTWSVEAHQAAFKHSREMKIRNYFSHDSKWSGNLKTRLQRERITFEMAGENIAAHYPDAAAVSLGWLNSPDHRENLLNRSFSQLGVGSYHDYYTQDFVLPMNE